MYDTRHDVFSSAVIELGQAHPELVVLSADLGDSCELSAFRERFPDRYLHMGIAEQNMCSWAAGLAREGFRPLVATFGVFLYRRALDQIEMSIASSGLPVILVGFVPGLSTSRGRTHQAISDVAVMRSIPGMTILDCGDATEVQQVLEAAYKLSGPVYIRMLRGEVQTIFDPAVPFRVGQSVELTPADALGATDGGADITLISSSICTGLAQPVVESLCAEGASIRHLHVATLKPFGDELLLEAIRNTRGTVVTYENHSITGGLGSAVAEFMAQEGLPVQLKRVGVPDIYAQSGSLSYLLEKCGMDAASLERILRELL